MEGDYGKSTVDSYNDKSNRQKLGQETDEQRYTWPECYTSPELYTWLESCNQPEANFPTDDPCTG